MSNAIDPRRTALRKSVFVDAISAPSWRDEHASRSSPRAIAGIVAGRIDPSARPSVRSGEAVVSKSGDARIEIVAGGLTATIDGKKKAGGSR